MTRYPWYEHLQDHLSLFRQYYLAAIVVVLLFGAIFFFAREKQEERTERAGWPTATATISEVRVQQDDATGDTGPLTMVTVSLNLHFKVAGEDVVTSYLTTEGKRRPSDYADSLRKQSTLVIRYDPADPRVVSLYPYFK